MVDGGPMYCCFISPEGDAFIESYWLDENLSTQVERSRRAEIETVVLGPRNLPFLAELVPQRPPDADTCCACSGKGFVSFEHGRTKQSPFSSANSVQAWDGPLLLSSRSPHLPEALSHRKVWDRPNVQNRPSAEI